MKVGVALNMLTKEGRSDAEVFAEHMALPPWDLAWSYIQRSGRVDEERLGQVSPRFVAGYRARTVVGPSG